MEWREREVKEEGEGGRERDQRNIQYDLQHPSARPADSQDTYPVPFSSLSRILPGNVLVQVYRRQTRERVSDKREFEKVRSGEKLNGLRFGV